MIGPLPAVGSRATSVSGPPRVHVHLSGPAVLTCSRSAGGMPEPLWMESAMQQSLVRRGDESAIPIQLYDPGRSELAPVGYVPTGAGALEAELADPSEIVRLGSSESASAARLTISAYYADHFWPWRQARLAAGTISPATIATEQTHVRAYAAWDEAEDRQPSAWPASIAWEGLPLSHLTSLWVRRFLTAQALSGWSWHTCRSCWTSLRTILNHARASGVVDSVPTLRKLQEEIRNARLSAGDGADDVDDAPEVVPYSDAELGRLYAVIDGVIAASLGTLIRSRSAANVSETAAAIAQELRTLIVLASNCGPRPEDLLRLCDRHVRRDELPAVLQFRARKTGKKTRVPLAAVTCDHLDRLRRLHGTLSGIEVPLFPHLISLQAKSPMDSNAKRRTIKLFRAMLTASGLDESMYRCPLHSLRKSCSTRFNRHGTALNLGQVGKLITHGKDADVNARYYDNKWPEILRAVETIDWPQEFSTH